jgi:uncharacterized protein (DUF885 family)
MRAHSSIGRGILALAFGGALSLLLSPTAVMAQEAAGSKASPAPSALASVPPVSSLIRPVSEYRDVVERYTTDQGVLIRRYDVVYSPNRRARLRDFYSAWRTRLREADFEGLSQEAKADYLLLENRIRYELELLDREENTDAEMAPLIPFASKIVGYHEAWRLQEPVDPVALAASLNGLAGEIARARHGVEAGLRGDARGIKTTPIVAYRAAATLDRLRTTLREWHGFYSGYDPLFTWWTADPYGNADMALAGYIGFLRERVVGVRPDSEGDIIGDPIGADGMRADLEVEMIPYTPEELVVIGEREFAWLEAEMKKASRELGFGDDWKAALEKVKTLHAEPGSQTEVVRMLAQEAVDFMEAGGWVTIPPLAKEVWRVRMMPPAQQRVSPFFLGGEVIQVAYPTDEMTHEEKLMSMRGNNLHFSRATVHHELIPGHHLQGFMNSRYNSYRRTFRTPFWTEGGALYWEFFLWDHGFPKTPEDRIGMLFWRMHRAARIIFSLNFHLGKMTPQEAIDFLVDRVGHERANAEAEVRRSFLGTYSPLYQVAYMIGGLQIRALHQELVGSGRMTDLEFHDALYQGGNMPIAMVRARLTGQKLERGGLPPWKFAGEVSIKASRGR